MDNELLRVNGLKISYAVANAKVRAVDDATFAIPRGSIVGLVGESGCGKTTVARGLTRVMAKAARIDGGEILFDGTDLLALNETEMNRLRWRDIAFIPQSAMNSLDPVYRIEQQLNEVLIQRGGMSKAEARRRSEELFEMVGIEPRRLRDFPHQFSGGMRQRVAIALALALNPKLVIADEPVTALDVIVQRQILDTLKSLQEKLGISVILVTHDISVVAYVCDRIVVMYAGRVVESGDTETVLTKPCHPYTMGLYNAFPDLQSSAGLLTPIEGHPPDLRDPPTGCRFAPRCPFVKDQCRSTDVALVDVGGGHASACLRHAEANALRKEAERSETWAAMA
ncbi:ABC transporter ATP-binding protein [Hoeflea prorocentri]|uniref:ABC transporter ATP-binding protein n=1 Tax=Hoeflea prorocentri TaxID=1922333 RepID=A0A9X3UL69_9HYPH|nr:ABC transporter ATP-binding protein [Hoeflea prorocentri]MCY6382597.1 ABC transporter ATP-binding protein [Hoeflea prorocentri]MDA5400397.1 ABC transporter ATP-binding protein [Hoeflea prorocentri]